MYIGRMPKMQVYLSQDLHAAVKELELPASRLLQDAVRAEVARRALVADAWAYVEETEALQGAPSDAEMDEARKWARRLVNGDDADRRAAG